MLRAHVSINNFFCLSCFFYARHFRPAESKGLLSAELGSKNCIKISKMFNKMLLIFFSWLMSCLSSLIFQFQKNKICRFYLYCPTNGCFPIFFGKLIVSRRLKIAHTAKEMKFFIKDFFSKCDQFGIFLQIWSHLPKKS